MVKIEIEPHKKEICIELPKEVSGKITNKECEQISEKAFSIAAILNEIVNREK